MDTLFMTADEVAKEMNVSKAYAYKVIQRMNAELVEMGYYTVSGNNTNINNTEIIKTHSFPIRKGTSGTTGAGT